MQWKRAQLEVEVRWNNLVLASSQNPIFIKEVGKEIYDTVIYIPHEDVEFEWLKANFNRTHCPIKGDASYWDFDNGQDSIQDVAWSYEEPIKKSQVIKNYVAFYADKVELITRPIPENRPSKRNREEEHYSIH